MTCDYQGVADSCQEFKTYHSNNTHASLVMYNEWHKEAQKLRLESEEEKCDIEQKLLYKQKSTEVNTLQGMLDKCTKDFQGCVDVEYLPKADTYDCSQCDSFCDVMAWNKKKKTNECTKDVCLWNFDCVDPMIAQNSKCMKMGCKCAVDPCVATTTKATTNTTTTLGANTTTTTPVQATTTASNSTTTVAPTTTSGNTTTSIAKGFTCPQVCPKSTHIAIVFAGQPINITVYTKKDLGNLNGIYIDSTDILKNGTFSTHSCRNYFGVKDRYWINGSKKGGGGGGFQNYGFTEKEFPDLGCGYTGNFDIECNCGPLESGKTYLKESECPACHLTVSIKTCNPPTYAEAVKQCIPEQVLKPPKAPVVQEFMKVASVDVKTPEPLNFTIPDVLTVSSCCETHVASVCRREVNYPHHGNLKNGQWEPEKSYQREAAYFPMVKCEAQAKAQPRMCQHAFLNVTNIAEYLKYPKCAKACNESTIGGAWKKFCNEDIQSQMAAEAESAHKEKVASMATKRAHLEAWVYSNSIWVEEKKSVHPCIDKDTHWSAPMKSFRSGYEHLKMDKTCQVKGCKPDQCLEVKETCDLPFMDWAPERQCKTQETVATLTCVDQVEISTHSSISVIISTLFFAASFLLCCASMACCRKRGSIVPSDNFDSAHIS